MLGRASNARRPAGFTRIEIRRHQQIAKRQNAGERRADFVGEASSNEANQAADIHWGHPLGTQFAQRSSPRRFRQLAAVVIAHQAVVMISGLGQTRSEERRVGKECRSEWWPGRYK